MVRLQALRQDISYTFVSKEASIIDKIMHSIWWMKASVCADNHFHYASGVTLADHLIAVTDNLETIFSDNRNRFLADLFAFATGLGLNKSKIREVLKIVSLLHDIGKSEADKTKLILHPLHRYLTLKQHAIVSVSAAMEILAPERDLSPAEKKRIYAVIEEHDVSYGLFKDWKETGRTPAFERWEELNDKIDTRKGYGLMYLLIFKLADIHGHSSIEDVTWFFKTVKKEYFDQIGWSNLPVPVESDIR